MIDLEKNYIDLGKWFQSRESYCDWEGFADHQQCLDLLKEALGPNRPSESEQDKIAFTLTLHYIYERTDTYELPNKDEVMEVWGAFHSLLTSRWYMKEDV